MGTSAARRRARNRCTRSCVECADSTSGRLTTGDSGGASDGAVSADVFPSVEDTADTLAARLGGCDFLDDIHFKKGGHGKGGATKAINKSKYPQPRRKTWSVVVDSSQEDQPPHSQDQAALYEYTQFGRKPSDWRSSPMPMEVFALSILLWRLAMPYLGAVSKASPPTAVQVMMYYVPCNYFYITTLRPTSCDLLCNQSYRVKSIYHKTSCPTCTSHQVRRHHQYPKRKPLIQPYWHFTGRALGAQSSENRASHLTGIYLDVLHLPQHPPTVRQVVGGANISLTTNLLPWDTASNYASRYMHV